MRSTVFPGVLNRSAAAALVGPRSITLRIIASRPFDVRVAVSRLFIWSLRGTLTLSNLSFHQMDNHLRTELAAGNACGGLVVVAQSFPWS